MSTANDEIEENCIIPTPRDPSAFQELARLLTGRLILPTDAAYEDVRRLWNGRIQTRPTALVRCATVQDVMHTVRWARSHGTLLSVRGGGHDVAGRALCEDGVVIDCSAIGEVSEIGDGRQSVLDAPPWTGYEPMP